MTSDDKLFAALWFPLALAVFYYSPERWPRWVLAFLMGAASYYLLYKWAKGDPDDADRQSEDQPTAGRD